MRERISWRDLGVQGGESQLSIDKVRSMSFVGILNML